MSPLELFLQHIVECHYDDATYENYASSVFDEYVSFVEVADLNTVENVKKFANKLKRLNRDGFTNNHTNSGSYYVFDIPKMRTHFKLDDLPDGMDSDSDTDTH